MKPNINWIIHLVMNGVQCVECGDVENSFMPYTCNCHTHGMEQYGHPDFQVVINYPNEEIGRILNTLGLRVQAGEKFKDGDYVTGIYDLEEDFFPQFIANRDMMIKLMNDLPIHGGE